MEAELHSPAVPVRPLPIPVGRAMPPAPPRIPLARRVGRALFGAWPVVAWCGALVTAVWLYSGLTDRGQALAREEVLEVIASPSVSARIDTLEVRLGALVQQGEKIATLDARELDAELRLARTKLERSRTRIAAARDELELEARGRRAQASARRSSHESEGRRIRTAIDELLATDAAELAEVEALTPQIERLRPLTEDNLITRDRLEQLVLSRSVLEARIASRAESARRAHDELSRWERLAPDTAIETDLSVRLVPYELELDAQEARVAELLVEREKYTVLAPATGVVCVISARPGEWRDAGDDIAQIVVTVPHRVTAYVQGAHARMVGQGSRATLHPRDREGVALEGRVMELGPRMELVPEQLRANARIPEWGRRVSIAISNSESPLPGEMYTVRFR